MAGIIASRASSLPPTHPGEMLREEYLPQTGKTVTELARMLRVSRQTLHDLLGERRGVSTEMALRLGKLFGQSPEFWLNLQRNYDLKLAQIAMADEVALIQTFTWPEAE